MSSKLQAVQVFNPSPPFDVAQDRLSSPASRRCRKSKNSVGVMLSAAKHLAASDTYENEILRLCLRMTLRHGLVAEEEGGGWNQWNNKLS